MDLKNLTKNKILLLCLIICPVLLLIFPLYELAHLTYTIFPAEDNGNRIVALTDAGVHGKSTIEEFSLGDKYLVLKFTVREGAAYPWVFITINLGSMEKGLDLSGFDSVSLRVQEATVGRILFFLKSFVPGVSSHESKNAQTLRHNQYILQLSANRQDYTIRLKDFITPQWWLDAMHVDAIKLAPEAFKQVITFDLQFNRESSNFVLAKPESIVIENISFHRALSLFSYLMLGLVIVYYAGWGLVLTGNKLGKKQGTLPHQKSLVLASYREQELARIKDYLEANYNDVNISTQMVYKALGIPASRVFELVKEEYHLTFKQLIQKMRIAEARRLLSETDLRISDIAFNLGFNNISYFINLFKKQEGESPSAYREKKKHAK